MRYSAKYQSSLLRGDEDPRPWDFIAEVVRYTPSGGALLDIGCGTATKLIQLAKKLVRDNKKGVKIFGVDPNQQMRSQAQENIKESGMENIFVVDGFDEKIPFANGTFDVATCMVAPHDTFEMHRVLKKGGHALLDKMGERDKHNLNVLFCNDAIGPRGQLVYLRKGQRAEMYRTQFGLVFGNAEVRDGFWNTYYTTEGLAMIFEQTASIRDFDAEKDAAILREMEKRYMAERGIKTQQHRVFVHAVK